MRRADPHGGASADPPPPRPRQPPPARIRGCATTRSRSTKAAGSTRSRSSKNTTRSRSTTPARKRWAAWSGNGTNGGATYEPAGSALIVHGPNSDVDLVNELAQQKRLEAGELGEQAIRAVDRDYLLHPGDLVAVRNAAYTFPAQPGQPRPKRIENGQVAIVEAVDPERDTLTLLLGARLRTANRRNRPGTPARRARRRQARRPRSGSTMRFTASPRRARPSTAPPRSPVTGPKPSRRPTSATPARSTATPCTSPARTSAPTALTKTASAATRIGSPPTANGCEHPLAPRPERSSPSGYPTTSRCPGRQPCRRVAPT